MAVELEVTGVRGRRQALQVDEARVGDAGLAGPRPGLRCDPLRSEIEDLRRRSRPMEHQDLIRCPLVHDDGDDVAEVIDAQAIDQPLRPDRRAVMTPGLPSLHCQSYQTPPPASRIAATASCWTRALVDDPPQSSNRLPGPGRSAPAQADPYITPPGDASGSSFHRPCRHPPSRCDRRRTVPGRWSILAESEKPQSRPGTRGT